MRKIIVSLAALALLIFSAAAHPQWSSPWAGSGSGSGSDITITGTPAAGDLFYFTDPTTGALLNAAAINNVLISGGPGVAPSYGKVGFGAFDTQSTNTLVGNATSGNAVPAALGVPSCSTTGSALAWTTNTGFSCNTAIAASTATTATNVSGGAISGTTLAASGTLTLSGTQDNISAAGTTQGTATVLDDTKAIYRVTTVTSNQGVLLPVSTAGMVKLLQNAHPSTGVKVYPSGSETIGAAGAGVAVTFANGRSAVLVATTAGHWDVYGITSISTSNNVALTLTESGFLNISGPPSGRMWSSTAPTLASGGCTTPSAITANGTSRFSLTVGTGCSGNQPLTFTLTAATTGWECKARNASNGATSAPAQTGAVSTTSVTITNFVRTTGVEGAWIDNDEVVISCQG